MSSSRRFSVGNFLRLSRINRDTLYHYDRIGLLNPSSRGDNRYRYYSSGQLAAINVIRILQDLGMPLDEIKDISIQRTPQNMYDMLIQKTEKINDRIDDMVRSRKLINTILKSIQSALNVDEDAITVKFIPEESIILGDINDYSNSKNPYDALLDFYDSINRKYINLDLNYPVWGKFSEEQIKQGEWELPNRYYFYNPEGLDKKPAALYAIGYARGGYGATDKLYQRMVEYIDNNNYEICGDTYEEYPLNEVCISDDTNYLIRVMITVREKQ